MWAEIAGGSVIMALVGVVTKMQNNRTNSLDKEVKEKTDKSMCDQRYGELINKLVVSDKRFDKIDTTLEEHRKMTVSQGELLARIDTKLDLLNGKKGGKR